LGSVPVRACSLFCTSTSLSARTTTSSTTTSSENDYFQYDYAPRENDYISVNDYFPKAVRGTSLQRLATASTQYDYTEQGPSTTSMPSPRDNGALVDSVNRPAFGYTLNLFCVILFEFYLTFNLNTSTFFAFTGSLIFVMNMLIISGIKMYRKLPNFLTVATQFYFSCRLYGYIGNIKIKLFIEISLTNSYGFNRSLPAPNIPTSITKVSQ
jgi:hypothetical protein